MVYEWDAAKARSNLAKHGVDFADAVGVLSDTAAMTIEDASAEERRFVTIGTDPFGRLLVVVYTWRGEDAIRLISARQATRAERRAYEVEP